ncbi:dihydropteroate synthase [Kocuria coralli]|uniref:Dihydropteroate synthase n=1 Tax=Kocuria coralli TaxID=1461025 RepID=A0A5J5KWT6_9MICC|nr:dihydropteroate synthase [Kocuria coralli]KAA9394129.1 dihydropteroate synthase [Kocuria coralli]
MTRHPQPPASAGSVPSTTGLGWGGWEDLPAGRTLIMGVLNVTPDSFSDGGLHESHRAAIDHGLLLARQGADMVDVGGESTRPGSTRVDPAEERRRILPVVRELADAGIVVTVDTINASTARAALDAGAHCVNDVSGVSVTDDMVRLVAERQAPYILMHSRGNPGTMDSLAVYDDLVGDVLRESTEVAERFLSAGLDPARLVLDPGLGFAKGGQQDWELLQALPRFVATGYPVLVAASRKRFVGNLLADRGVPRPVEQRDLATAAISALAADRGAWAVRVHDVPASVDTVAVAHAWRGVRPPVLRPADRPGTTEGQA